MLNRGQINPKYKLACQIGTLKSLVTASSLILSPGPVSLSVERSNTKMSLREAARKHSVMKNDIIKCKCKSGCKTTIKSVFPIAIKAGNVVMVMNVMPMRTLRMG